MGQGCTGGPATYTKLKDVATGPIPSPHAEPAPTDTNPGHVCFDHFIDDDVGGAGTFDALVDFLHSQYFPRLTWAKLTLNPTPSGNFSCLL